MAKRNGVQKAVPATIRSVTVSGFKSLAKPQTLTIRPLTVLAGANSSGKSSIMQPLLLMKQTLEHPVEEPDLVTSGPLIDLGIGQELLTRYVPARKRIQSCKIAFGLSNNDKIELDYSAGDRGGLRIEEQRYFSAASELWMRYRNGREAGTRFETVSRKALSSTPFRDEASLEPYRGWILKRTGTDWMDPSFAIADTRLQLHDLIFVGSDRTPANLTTFGAAGGFERSVGAIVSSWYQSGQVDSVARHTHDLATQLDSLVARMGLASHIEAKRGIWSDIEIRVSRTTKAKADPEDSVPLALAGSGLASALPTLVGLILAGDHHLVYIQEPEKHLHPAAQRALARIICDFTRRGASLVVETHSSIMLREIQTQVALEKLVPNSVAMHWFTRDSESGFTNVQLAELDDRGAYGDWPIDFDDVYLDAESMYIQAATASSKRS